MNTLVVISACLCAASAFPQYYPYTGFAGPYTAAVAPIVAPAPEVTYEYNVIPDTAPPPEPAPLLTAAVPAPAFLPNVYKTQYHSQDELGQFAFGHASPGQAHAATRDYTGAVRGSYTYIDSDGKEVVAHYVADQGGFRVSSNALPVAPTFDGEAPVAPEAKLEAPVFDLEPVTDTPEVEAAKDEHFRLVEEHKAAVAAALVEAEEDTSEDVTTEETPVEAQEAEEEVSEEEEEAAEETATEAPEEEESEEEEKEERKKRSVLLNNQILFPEYYKSVEVEPLKLEVKTPEVLPATATLRDAELLRIVHNPGHGVSYRVY